MIKKRNSFWWQSPRRAVDIIANRRVSFLELFYDLAYVGYIGQITHGLADSPSLSSLAEYLILFLIGWWAWVNGSSYLDTHGNDDIRTRVMTFLQMIAIVSMSIFSHNAFVHSEGFVISYTFFLLLMTHLWYQTGISDPLHRRMSLPYSICFFLSAVIMVSSLYINHHYQMIVWLIGIFVSMAAVIFHSLFHSRNTDFDDPYSSFKVSETFKERTGIFTIIIVGEIILGIINAASKLHHLTGEHLILIFLSTCLAIMVWWFYFDFITRRMPKKGTSYHYAWLFGQIPVLSSINILGACASIFISNNNLFGSTEFSNLFIGASIVFLISVMLIWQILDKSKEILNLKIFQPLNILGIILLILLKLANIEGMFLLLFVNLIFAIILLTTIIRAFRIYQKQNYMNA